MHQIREFRVPPSIHFGQGASLKVGTEAKALGSKHALLVTDKFMSSHGLCAPIIESLEQAGFAVAVYDGVNSEPDLHHVAEALALQKQHNSEVVVGFGGGSPIDAAKAVCVLATNGGTIEDYMGLGKVSKAGIPLIAIPTTAGTGSEATQFTIITDTSRDVKMLIGSHLILPRVALLDPDLTLGMPKGLTAATGLDALTHGIEAYVSKKAQPMSDVLALSAIRLLGKNLYKAWQNPTDYEARSNTLLGALQAGIAFSNASVGLVHGMSRPIGALYHVPHGVSNATLLEVVMDFSLPGNMQRYADIAVALGVHPKSSVEETARAGMSIVKDMVAAMEIPSLSKLGVSRDKLDATAAKMADDAIASGSPGNNPRVATKEEIIELYYKAL